MSYTTHELSTVLCLLQCIICLVADVHFIVVIAVDAFSEDRITANVLKQILRRKDVVLDIKINEASEESRILYEKGKVADYFMMVIQGHVDVTVGMEKFTFPQGIVNGYYQFYLPCTQLDYYMNTVLYIVNI